MNSTEIKLELRDIFDTDIYPLDRLDSPRAKSLIESCRTEIDQHGYALLENFLTPNYLQGAIKEAEGLYHLAHHKKHDTNPYRLSDDPSLPPDHPKRHFEERSNAFISRDKLAENSLFLEIYKHDVFLDLLSKCFCEPNVFRFEDYIGCVTLSLMEPGSQLAWHFDEHDLNIVIMLTASKHGSIFEISPHTRTFTDENYPKVSRVLKGDRSDLKQLSASPGDLYIFNGKHSLHRVTRNTSTKVRYILSLAYTLRRKYTGNVEARKIVFGQ